jgi:hypothetical protein
MQAATGATTEPIAVAPGHRVDARRRFARRLDLRVALLALAGAWAFGPLVAAIVHVAVHGGVLTGVNGSDYFDQFQYLAWIRDEGTHLLASNLWVPGPTPHDYLQPMYLVSGLLWRAGLGLQVAYLIWKPTAVLVLVLGCAAYAQRLLPERRAGQFAAVVLMIFYETPVLALAHWTGHLSPLHQYQLLLATDDGYSAVQLWGFEHTALTIGLMPVFLLGFERLIAVRSDDGRPAGGRGALAATALGGMFVSWLHPWQGVMLLGVAGAMFVLRAPRGRFLRPPVLVALVATGAPLLYGFALSHFDTSWRAFEAATVGTGTAPWWALLAAFGPLGALAAVGARRPADDGEWMLLLWLAACAGVYFLVPQFPPHALAGLVVPLSVLAVRGWGRLGALPALARRTARRPAARVAGVVLALAALAAVTVPAAVDHAQGVADDFGSSLPAQVALGQMRLTDDQARALAYLDHARARGAVLAPWFLSLAVPGFTGRSVFVGHLQWEPRANLGLDEAFFSLVEGPAAARLRRAILVRSTARFVLADCGAPSGLAGDIEPLARPVARFGCVTVYERG